MNLKLRSVRPMIYTYVHEGMVVIVHYYTIKQDSDYPFKLYVCKCRQKNLKSIGDHINTKLRNKDMQSLDLQII